jgi:D-arabinose 1-dehydrogenase-like Zn-dependent alcohol dehydrogenase
LERIQGLVVRDFSADVSGALFMKAAVVPTVNGKWEVKEWQTPKAGPNQVVIKIHASGLCYTEVHLTRGLFALQFPRVLGHEPVGEIVEVGPGVTSRKLGDRVGVGWVQRGCGRCEWCLRGEKGVVPEQHFHRHLNLWEPCRIHVGLCGCNDAYSRWAQL